MIDASASLDEVITTGVFCFLDSSVYIIHQVQSWGWRWVIAKSFQKDSKWVFRAVNVPNKVFLLT